MRLILVSLFTLFITSAFIQASGKVQDTTTGSKANLCDTLPAHKDSSGIPVSVTEYNEAGLFEKVEVEAAFPGGEEGWLRFLLTNLNPEVPVTKGAPAGTYTVVVQFIVDREGLVKDIKALTRNSYGMELEVIRMLKKSPKWTPAQQAGNTVKAYRKQPVTFVVQEEKSRRRKG